MPDEKIPRWALCPWSAKSDVSLVHPEDLEALRAFRPYGFVFRTRHAENGYVTIRYGRKVFKVQSEALKPIMSEEDRVFEPGDTVLIRISACFGVVEHVMWHHEQARPVYWLRVGGKPKSKRHWPEDLEKAQGAR